MEAIKLEPSDESGQIVLSHPFENKPTIDQLRMTFKAAIQRIEVHVKSDSGRKTAKRQLTEEELEARRRINRIRMAATRAARTLEQIEADRMSQRARMAALRRRRSEQELKSVLGSEQGAQGEVDVVEVSRNNVSVEPRVRRSSSSRRQLTPEELEIRRRINRLRVAMMRAERTEEQIEADRKAQRLRMAELRRRRSEEQIAADLESQRARMAALRRERRSRLREEEGGCSGREVCRQVVKQEVDEEQPSALAAQPSFQPAYPDANHTVETAVLHQGVEWQRRQAVAAEKRRQWRVKLSPEEIEERKRKAAERMRVYRATLRATLSPQELQERKWKAAERMRQWRASLTPEELARMRAKGLERARRWRSQRGAKACISAAEESVSSSSTTQQQPQQEVQQTSCAVPCPDAPSTLGRWEKTTQDQGGGRLCGGGSFKDCLLVPPYFGVPTSRDCETTGCGEWTPHSSSGSIYAMSPHPLVPSPPPPRFLPHPLLPPPPPHTHHTQQHIHHIHHHHHQSAGELPDVSTNTTTTVSPASDAVSRVLDPSPNLHLPQLQQQEQQQQQQEQQQQEHSNSCVHPPSAPMLPPLPTAGMMAPLQQRPLEWPRPHSLLLGFEGFPPPPVHSPSGAHRAHEDPRP